MRIVGSSIYDGVEENQVELVTEGKLYKRGGVIYLTYDESEFSGMEGCKTRLILDGDTICMTRKGTDVGINTEIHFQKGQRHSGYYDTPYGPIEMEVLTNELFSDVTGEEGGSIEIDYHISLKGLSEGRSRLNIQVGRRQ